MPGQIAEWSFGKYMTQFDEIELNYKVDVNLNSVNETGKFKYIDIYF